MSGNERSSAEIVRLLEECLDAREQGGEAAMETLIASRPEHAAAIRARLDALSRTGLLDGDGEMPERLGDFRLIEPIGSGGMGVVYLAEQESVGRRVAVKLVHPEHLFFPGARERFRREVEAVRRLDHPGITPVYAVGEADGVPYFAMEHVAGVSLDNVLAALRGKPPETLDRGDLFRTSPDVAPREETTLPESWVDVCFTLARQIAEALAHAHERGVLHRDVKPSNIVLTHEGRIRLLDFGLARSEGDIRITRTGSVLGSLPYMAPEQVRGDTRLIGPRTDVYGVGVTLYELLTLRPAYWSETTERTRRRVLDGQPVSIERLNSAVPRDAETICRKAMDFDPAHRYASMAALAVDLGRFLRREPVAARRPGHGVRLRRWAQRRPTLATALTLGSLLVVGGPIGFAVQSESARAEISTAYQAEAEQRLRAETELESVIAAIDEMLAAATDAELIRTPGGDAVRRRMLESARRMYEGLLAREQERPGVARRVATTQQKLAQLHLQLGSVEPAREAARAAVAVAGRLGPGVPGAEELPFSVALRLIEVLIDTAEIDEAIERIGVQLDELHGFEDAGLDAHAERRRQLWLARAWDALSEARLRRREIEASLDAARKSISAYELAGAADASAEVRIYYARRLEFNAYIGGFHGLEPDYANLFERANALRRGVMQEDPGEIAVRFGLGESQAKWAHIELKRRQWAPGIERSQQAHETLVALADDFPGRPRYVETLLGNVARLGYALEKDNRREEAIEVLRDGLDRAIAATQRHTIIDFRYHEAVLSGSLAAQLGRAERPDEAEPYWEQSRKAWEWLMRQSRPSLEHVMQVGVHYDQRAHFEYAHDRHEKALALAALACKYHRLAHERARMAVSIDRLGKSLVLMAAIEMALDHPAQAVARLAEAVREAGVTRDRIERQVFRPLAGRADYRSVLDEAPLSTEAGTNTRKSR